MPRCQSKIFADDEGVTFDISHHQRTGRRPPDFVECVWPAGHVQHHSSATAVWPNTPGSERDFTVPTPEEAAAQADELRLQVAALEKLAKGGK